MDLAAKEGGGENDENGDSKGEKKFKDLQKELIDPYYTGSGAREFPALFVLHAENAFIVTGPDPMFAL